MDTIADVILNMSLKLIEMMSLSIFTVDVSFVSFYFVRRTGFVLLKLVKIQQKKILKHGKNVLGAVLRHWFEIPALL